MLLTEDYQAMNLTFTESRIDESSTSKSNVISFERWQTHTHTHTLRTDRFTQTTKMVGQGVMQLGGVDWLYGKLREPRTIWRNLVSY